MDIYEIRVRKDGREYYPNRRAQKRAERKGLQTDPCYDAHCLGQWDAERGKFRPHRYPPGKRRENYLAAHGRDAP